MPALLSYSGPSFPADAQKRVGRCSVVDFWPDILTAGGATGRQENGKTSGDGLLTNLSSTTSQKFEIPFDFILLLFVWLPAPSCFSAVELLKNFSCHACA